MSPAKMAEWIEIPLGTCAHCSRGFKDGGLDPIMERGNSGGTTWACPAVNSWYTQSDFQVPR